MIAAAGMASALHTEKQEERLVAAAPAMMACMTATGTDLAAASMASPLKLRQFIGMPRQCRCHPDPATVHQRQQRFARHRRPGSRRYMFPIRTDSVKAGC